MVNAHTSMSDRQSRFIREYCLGMNGTRAAIAAGYGRAGAHVAASRLLRNAKVRDAIAAAQAQDAQRLQIERLDVIKGLLEACAMAKVQRDPAAMIAGAREVGRMLGYYAPEGRRLEVADDRQGTYDAMNSMSDAELHAIIAAA